MTSVTFNKNVFLKTLEAFQQQFQLSSTTATLETEPSGDRFQLSADREGSKVQAFGSCAVDGAPVSIAFDLVDLTQAIREAYEGQSSEELTLLVADSIWVKDPAPMED